jgi:hypothetical protein
MLKRLAIVAVLMVGFGNGAWPQVPGNGSQQEKDAQKQQGSAKRVQPTSVAIHAQNEASEQKQGSEQKPAKYPWGELLAPANIPNWVLVIVAALTGGVICWQSKETRTAAQSAEKQIALQSIAMRQWVNVEPIKAVTPPAFQDPIEITLQFQVLNRTDYLITVKKIEAEVFHRGKARIFKVSCSVPVPPKKSTSDGGHPFYLTLFVDRNTWPETGTLFFAGGEVTYLDCMDIERTQEFRDLFQAYEDGRLVRKRPSGMVPEVAVYKPEGEDDPNPS